MTNRAKLQGNQSGLVSFFVVLIIMLLLTLIVLSFARIVRREQRQALDRQLNSQASYAAESGVNDAYSALLQNSGLRGRDFDQCSGNDSFVFEAGINSQLDGTTSYSCLLVDPSPESLNFSNISKGSSRVVPIRPKQGEISSIQIQWQPAASDVDFENRRIVDCPMADDIPSNNVFGRELADGCNFATLRVEFVPFSGSVSRHNLITDRSIFFAHPARHEVHNLNVGQVTYLNSSDDKQGAVIAARCIGSPTRKDCTATLTGGSWTNGYLKISSIYGNSGVKITAVDTDNGAVELVGAQVEIDVTGKANDVLKRVREYRMIPTGGLPYPDYALQSAESQCKRFSVTGSGVSNAGSDPACLPW